MKLAMLGRADVILAIKKGVTDRFRYTGIYYSMPFKRGCREKTGSRSESSLKKTGCGPTWSYYNINNPGVKTGAAGA